MIAFDLFVKDKPQELLTFQALMIAFDLSVKDQYQ